MIPPIAYRVIALSTVCGLCMFAGCDRPGDASTVNLNEAAPSNAASIARSAEPAAAPSPQASSQAGEGLPPGGSDQAGGVVLEYMGQRDFGTGQGSGKPDADGQIQQIPNARQAAKDFLKARNLKEGPNGNGVITFIGDARIDGTPSDTGWNDNRLIAASKAMNAAKREFVQYLAAQVQTRMRNLYQEKDPFAAMEDAKKLAEQPPEQLSLLDKAIVMANHEMDKFMRERGATVPPDNTAEREKLAQDMRDRAAKLFATDEFMQATEVAAQAEISGLQAFRFFESASVGNKGPSISVVAIYSPKAAKVQLALLGKGPAPTDAPKTAIESWAEELGAEVLMYTHGCQPRTNEKGEVVLVAFGQVTPISNRPDRGRALSRATTRAFGEARMFLGEYVQALDTDMLASTVQEYVDEPSIVRNESQYVSKIESRAEKLDLPGGLNVYDWEYEDPATGKTTYGVVRVFSVSQALEANKIRDMMKKAGGAAGGRGLSNAKAPPGAASSGTNSPKGTGNTSGGAGAAGEDP